MRKKSDVLKKACYAVENGKQGLFSSTEYFRVEECPSDFIHRILPTRDRSGRYGFSPYRLTKKHRATILAFAYSIAKSEGE